MALSFPKHGDLYFLLHNNIVQYPLLHFKKNKKFSEGKKDTAESMGKSLTPNMQIMTGKTTTL